MRIKIRFRTIRPQNTEPLSSMDGWAKWVLFMMLGSAFGRTFYYIGIPPAKIFIGEIVLVLFFILRPRETCDRWISALTKGSVFGPFAWLLLLSILWGIFEVLYGLHSGYSPLTALQNLVFNIYPMYFFLGLWVGSEHPTMMQKVVRGWAWILAIYGPAYVLFLHYITLTMPGTSDVPIFGQPGGGGMIVLSLLALERKPLRFWLPMLLAAIMMLVVQVRAEWLSMMLAFSLWGLLERKMTKVLSVAALVAVLLLAGFIADVNLPSPAERGGSISSREIVARGLSAISPEVAQEYTESRTIGFYAGTISWRTRWWSAIWSSVHESLPKMFIGNGYGFPLSDLVPYLKGVDIRTPHNVFFFALGYSGWIGVVLFFSLQFSILSMLWRAYKLTGESYGVVIWVASLTSALFGNSFESPMGAIPYYMMMGLIIGPALCRKLSVLGSIPLHGWTGQGSLAQQPAFRRVSPDSSRWAQSSVSS
jgi:hypothetical protein